MDYQILKRDGWTIDCPHCKKKIIYTIIKNQRPPVPFFYSKKTNDILLRKQDEQRVDKLYLNSNGATPSLSTIEALWNLILREAPETSHGGKFDLWSYVKCPHCWNELIYNNGVKDLNLRIFEPEIIVIDNAILFGDLPTNSYQMQVNITQPM